MAAWKRQRSNKPERISIQVEPDRDPEIYEWLMRQPYGQAAKKARGMLKDAIIAEGGKPVEKAQAKRQAQEQAAPTPPPAPAAPPAPEPEPAPAATPEQGSSEPGHSPVPETPIPAAPQPEPAAQPAPVAQPAPQASETPPEQHPTGHPLTGQEEKSEGKGGDEIDPDALQAMQDQLGRY